MKRLLPLPLLALIQVPLLASSLAQVDCLGTITQGPTFAQASCYMQLPYGGYYSGEGTAQVGDGVLSINGWSGPVNNPGVQVFAQYTVSVDAPTPMVWQAVSMGAAYGGTPPLAFIAGPYAFNWYADVVQAPFSFTLPTGTWTIELWGEVSDQGSFTATVSDLLPAAVPEPGGLLTLAMPLVLLMSRRRVASASQRSRV